MHERSREDPVPEASNRHDARALLHAAGRRVVVCGRTAHESPELRPGDGILDGWPNTLPGPVITDPARIEKPCDVVLLAVKGASC